MALMAERYEAQESLFRSERQRLFQISQFPAHQIVDKQQLAPPEQRWVLPRVQAPTTQGVEAHLGSDPIAARLPASSQEVPQPGVGLSTRVTLGHLTTEPGPAFALVCVKHLLGQGHVVTAREILQRALRQYPTDARLLNLYQAVSPGNVVRRDVRYSDRTSEMAWIQANRSHYRGKWVALLGEKVIAVGDSLKAVFRIVQEQQLEETPLIHHLD